MNTNRSKSQICSAIVAILFFPSDLLAQEGSSRSGTGIPVPWESVRDGKSPSPMLQWVKRLRNAGARPASEFEVNRLYDVHPDLHPLTFGLWDFRPTPKIPINQDWGEWLQEVQRILQDVGILSSKVKSAGSSTNEYSAEWIFCYNQLADSVNFQEALDGTPYNTVMVVFGISRSGRREDIDNVYYLARHFPRIAARPKQGISADPDEVVVGDACYRYGHGDNQTNGRSPIGFLRGNVVVEIHTSSHVWRTRDVPAGGVIEPASDPSLPDKVMEAARRIDKLLMEKMFDEPTRVKIRTAERARANKRPPQQ